MVQWAGARTVCVITALGGCGRLGFDRSVSAGEDGPGATFDAAEIDAVEIDGADLDAAVDASLILWLKLDDSLTDMMADDSSGHGHHAQCAAPTCPPQGEWLMRWAVGPFNGTAVRLAVPYDAELDVAGPFTLAAWVWTDMVGTDESFISKPVGPSDRNSYQLEMDGAGMLRCLAGDAVTTARTTNGDFISSYLSTWVHTACVFDGTDLRLFVNGAASGDPVAVGAITHDPTEIFIGADDNGAGPTNQFAGSLSDVRLYNRALSALELTALAGL
jgi:hypothetical protein